jgi:hypothetical protein
MGGNPCICDECLGVALEQLRLAGITSFANGVATISARELSHSIAKAPDAAVVEVVSTPNNERRLDSVTFTARLAGRFEEEKTPTPKASAYEPEPEE